MEKRWHLPLVLIFAVLVPGSAFAQNLEAIGTEDPVKLSGGLSLTQIGYGVNGIAARRSPYNYFLSGALNIDLYGMSIPLSFMLSNQSTSFRQPFNQFGITPVYKDFTGHLGFGSMSFSPYTLNGHIFFGAGVDYKPKDSPFNVSVMYGRLQKAVQPDSLDANNVPYFRRMGYGVKLGYDKNGDYVHLITFHAADEPSSLNYVPEKAGVLPQENLVLSVQGGKKIGPLSITGELASSAINRDVRVSDAELEDKNLFSYAGPLFRHNNSSEYYNAYKGNINYRAETFMIGLGYERIDPGYRTLGAYYFNNDLRNITLNASTSLLGNKVNVATSVGTQKNNLDNKESNQMNRYIGSVNVSYAPTNKLNLNASYSNFTTYTFIRSAFTTINQVIPVNNIDTLNYTQLSESATLGTSYLIGATSKARRMAIMNVSYQKATDRQGGELQNTGSRFLNGNFAYTQQYPALGLGFTVAVNTNMSTAGDIKSRTVGPTLGVNKTLLKKKMTTSATVSYNSQSINSERNNTVTNVRLMAGYRVQNHHNFSLSGIMLNRSSEVISSPDFTEYTVTLGYNYNF